jgi:Undecaprenyl-phosphate galactose phosphotransferase WbaP
MKDNIDSAEASAEDVASTAIKQTRFFRRLACAASLLAADVAAFASAVVLFRVGRQVPEIVFYRSLLPFQHTIDLFYIMAGLFMLIRYVAGDYSKRQLFWDEARLTSLGLAIASIPFFLVCYFSATPYSLYPDVFSWSFVIIAIPAYRQVTRYVLSRVGVWQLPTVLIGGGQQAVEVCNTLRQSLSLGFDVRFQVAFVDEGEYDRQVADVTRIGLKNPVNIVRRLSEAGCHEAIVVTDQMRDEDINEMIERLMAAGIEVAVVPQLRRLPMLGLTLNYFFGRDIILMHVRNNTARLPSRLIKRLIDLTGSVVLLLLILPFLIIIGVAIKLEGGTVFFVQNRLGKGGKEFPCIKFRTMRADAEEMLKRWQRQNSPLYEEYVASNFKLRDDPRVTRVGRCLRRTSLDELPQLINVLLGDMSLVGPRPLLAREIGDYGMTFNLYRQLRPGITGLWQISGRSRTTFAERAAADEWYVKNWSLWYDIVILFKTVDVLLRRDGAF